MNKTLQLRIGIGVAVVAMLTLGSLDLVQHYRTDPPAAFALSAVRAVPFLLFRRRPYLAWWLALAGSLLTTGVLLFTSLYVVSEPWPWTFSSVAVLAPMTGVLAAQGRRNHTVGAVALIALVGSWIAFAMFGPRDWISVITCTVLCTFAAVLGDVLHSRSRVVDHLATEKLVSSAERARRSLVEERARIARELHDVVAHHMSMITVQAETARYRFAGLPEPVVTESPGSPSWRAAR